MAVFVPEPRTAACTATVVHIVCCMCVLHVCKPLRFEQFGLVQSSYLQCEVQEGLAAIHQREGSQALTRQHLQHTNKHVSCEASRTTNRHPNQHCQTCAV